MSERRDFKGVFIPKEIYLNKQLSWIEKALLTEIDSLDCGDGCFKSNEKLAEFLQVSTGRCANIISKLRQQGLIIDKGYKSRRRLIGVNPDLTKTLNEVSRKREVSLNENVKSPIYTSISNTVSNTKDPERSETHKDDWLCS
jgi:biotin operon repressor